MIRKKGRRTGKIIIDLDGPEGNAFHLMGYAQRFANQLKIDHTPIVNDMMSGDYEHLLEVFDKHFGKFVILERS